MKSKRAPQRPRVRRLRERPRLPILPVIVRSSVPRVSSWIVSLLVQNLAPFLFSRAAHRRTRFGHGRKLAQPLVRPARVNDRARAVTLPVLRNDWIERAAPTAADDLDVFRRIRARRQRP